eukprot:2180362-Rhodomonas_salina.1
MSSRPSSSARVPGMSVAMAVSARAMSGPDIVDGDTRSNQQVQLAQQQSGARMMSLASPSMTAAEVPSAAFALRCPGLTSRRGHAEGEEAAAVGLEHAVRAPRDASYLLRSGRPQQQRGRGDGGDEGPSSAGDAA